MYLFRIACPWHSFVHYLFLVPVRKQNEVIYYLCCRVSYLYFIAWWLISVVLALNLFTALILEVSTIEVQINFQFKWLFTSPDFHQLCFLKTFAKFFLPHIYFGISFFVLKLWKKHTVWSNYLYFLSNPLMNL